MRSVEKSVFSLYPLGCRPRQMKPSTIIFLYKQFCQSIFRNNELNNILFESMREEQGYKYKRDDTSYGKQLKIIEKELMVDCLDYNSEIIIDLIENLFKSRNQGQIDSIKHFIFLIEDKMMKGIYYYYLYNELNTLLKPIW
ncbi:unnamed protein product [Brachionus calyciflorus]|uniref:Uncharacterized protein n=1 Tax=Brachionus calyciflorus TaxID=104777 RepID=A0A814JD55_9BILA|nr:unnamed protein product [Brachionus calyciflorus]